MELLDGTEYAQKVLAAVDQSGRIYGAAHVIDILRGVLTEKISKAGHNQRPAFGIGTELRKGEWQSVIRQLVAAQFLQLDVQGYGGLTITLKGEGLMRGQENFHYRKDTLKKTAPQTERLETSQQSLICQMLTPRCFQNFVNYA